MKKKMIRVPISFEAIKLLYNMKCLKKVDVELNKRGINLLTKSIESYNKKKKASGIAPEA